MPNLHFFFVCVNISIVQLLKWFIYAHLYFVLSLYLNCSTGFILYGIVFLFLLCSFYMWLMLFWWVIFMFWIWLNLISVLLISIVVAVIMFFIVSLCHSKRKSKFKRSFLTKQLPEISSDFVLGSQGDSHEFLRCLLDSVDNCCLQPKSKEKPSLEEDSLVKQVFGGRLKSQVSFWI